MDEINRRLTRVSTDMTYETQTAQNAYGVAGIVELCKGLSSAAGDRPAAGLASLMCRCPVLKRVLLRVFQIVNFQIDIKLGPVQMTAMKQLNILYRTEHLLSEVRIVPVIQKVLITFHKKPDAERRYVLNAYGNGLATP